MDIADALLSNNVPEATLALGGILAVIMTLLYLRDSRSVIYKLMMIVCLAFGVYMAVIAFNTYGTTHWAMTTCIIMAVAAFTLIIRPFKEVHFAVIIALLVMGLGYLLLGGLVDTQLEFLTEKWPRIALAVVAGVFVFSLLHMVESIVKMAGKILNAWPILLILGIVCIIEAAMVFTGHGSVYDFIESEFINK
ncbi:MAG: hypothetical protein LBV13_01975 [Methanomassiliicoccaceae archaeon]|jgi:hypothetical protein|nr:hypothetical protein [Methanomassiliicoccaceae archaeon]